MGKLTDKAKKTTSKMEQTDQKKKITFIKATGKKVEN